MMPLFNLSGIRQKLWFFSELYANRLPSLVSMRNHGSHPGMACFALGLSTGCGFGLDSRWELCPFLPPRWLSESPLPWWWLKGGPTFKAPAFGPKLPTGYCWKLSAGLIGAVGGATGAGGVSMGRWYVDFLVRAL